MRRSRILDFFSVRFFQFPRSRCGFAPRVRFVLCCCAVGRRSSFQMFAAAFRTVCVAAKRERVLFFISNYAVCGHGMSLGHGLFSFNHDGRIRAVLPFHLLSIISHKVAQTKSDASLSCATVEVRCFPLMQPTPADRTERRGLAAVY